MSLLQNKHILLGISGGIAAYKSADLVRRLREAGAEVRVVMTEAAQELITPLTFQALSAYPVCVDWQQATSNFAMDHIALARWADVVLIAPATADCLAKLAHGLASDVLTTLCLATKAPLAVAPAMNQQMWQHPATQANVQCLLKRGVRLFGPGSGSQACGDEGLGRMLEPLQLVTELAGLFAGNDLQGLRFMVTAGPTQEAIDPVRYISNHSSGKMGYALAQAAANAGAEVTLISGPTQLCCPSKVTCVPVVTAEQMHAAVMARIAACDIFIAAAAVADYRCATVAGQKLKKSPGNLELTLTPNPDILAAVSKQTNPPFTVGFAAETENLAEHALQKLQAKHLDMIAANNVADPDTGFGSEQNALLVLWEGGQQEFSLRPKAQLAMDLLKLIVQRYRQVPGARAARPQ